MKSCIYEGHVRHRRRDPVRHAFAYRIFLMYVDLDELPELFRGRWSWSADRRTLAWFRRRDYLGDPGVPLDVAVRDRVEARTGRRPRGPIRMLTQPRIFGFLFNPVTFYYCFAPEGDRVESVVAEITNTPWNERHAYVLCRQDRSTRTGVSTFELDKEFHVSPFMGMDIRYEWTFSEPGDRLGVRMTNLDGRGSAFFDASLDLRRREIDARSLRGVLVRYPFQTVRVFGAIYLQALRLWRKGAPFFTHPKKLPRDGLPGRGLRPTARAGDPR